MLSKKKQLEETVNQLNEKIAAQDKTIAELNAALETYKNKERVIIGALTRAQSDAVQIVEEAQQEKERIVNEALVEKKKAEKDAEAIIIKANADAQRIKAEADEYTKAKIVNAEAFMETYKENAKKLNKAMRKAAEDAAAQAEQFRAYFECANVDDEIEMAGEYCGISKMEQIDDLPEDYQNPAQLMQSIYRIENRPTEEPFEEAPTATDDIKVQAEEDETIKADETRGGEPFEEAFMTVDDVISEGADNTANEQQGEKSDFEKRIDEELNAIIDELLKEEGNQ